MSPVRMTWLSRLRRHFGAATRRAMPTFPRHRPRFDMLEDRVVPAFNLGITTNATVGVDVQTAAGTRTFTANATGANLDVDDILTALVTDDLNVVISTGSTGTEAGNILWDALADLDFNGLLNNHSLTLLTDASATVGSGTIDADITDSVVAGATLAVTIDTVINNGNVTLNGLLGGLGGLGGLNVKAGFSGTINLNGAVHGLDDVDFDAGLTNLNADISLNSVTVENTLSFQGNVDLGGGPRAITFTNIGFASTLQFNGGTVTIDQNLTVSQDLGDMDEVKIGGLAPTELEVRPTFTLDVVNGSLLVEDQSVLFGTGTVDADLAILSGGTLAPGSATAGTLTVANGDVFFSADAVFAITLGATTDQLLVTGGNVTIDADALLQGSGVLTVGTPVTPISASGTVTGNFNGTGGGVAFLLGDELVTANYTVGPPGSLTVQQVAAQPGKTFTTLTAGGDLVRIRLLGPGPGQLVVEDLGDDGEIDFIVVRNPRQTNTLQITVLSNGGPGTVDICMIVIQGGIGRIAGPAANVCDGLRVNGKLGSLALLSLGGEIELGGTNATSTRLSVVELVAGDLTSTGRITALVTFGISNMNIQAPSIGKLTVKANPVAFLPGEIFLTTVTVSNAWGPAKLGLGSVSVAGIVQDSTFNVLGGNVASFTTKRFLSSNLYVGYSPPLSGVFTDPGLFLGNFKVNVFRTTAIVFPTATTPDPVTLSFADSEVVAARLGTVRLASVNTNNGSMAFGLKVRQNLNNNVGSVRVAAPAPVPFSPTTNLLPGFVAGDFMFLQQP